MSDKKVGRPSAYEERFNAEAFKLCKLGAMDRELAEFFNVCEQTLNNWKSEYPEFFESIKSGKDIYDSNCVERALRERAIGASHPDSKVYCNADGEVTVVPVEKHYAPETAACIFWLKNRQPDRWSDKQNLDLTSDGKPVTMPSRIELVAPSPKTVPEPEPES